MAELHAGTMPGAPLGWYSASREDLAALLAGEPAYRVRQVWDGLYRRLTPPDAMTELPGALRAQLAVALVPQLTLRRETPADGGATRKWLFELQDGATIETVLMAAGARTTVCVSSQAGCAMACQFCATGQAGFVRHLDPGEIVEQVARAMAASRPRRLTNVVFMGMGEPLAAFDRTWAALERIVGDLGLSPRRLTLSTVGVVPGIRRLAETGLPLTLAVSLHAADDELRSQLVPLNRRYPLAALLEACEFWVARTGRRLSFEWALIDQVNDRPQDAKRLAGIARRLKAHVNLIPLNPTPGYPATGSPPQRVRRFRDDLVARGVNVTVRVTRGRQASAACGQLATLERRRDSRNLHSIVTGRSGTMGV
ncbi:23S rRNA (adenine(2503)-C(2))-methyltransferase RlmN [Aciditerrimonas ferrireducens]|uniref:Probable dual-specificity RNA methyltransferase RlmN n=1 Tax=Aciditerrimonas ferrireducens TaxID=667306 RepID=A0ABV6C3A6_9ACTN|nr:23S rRNA (adenine(2503)-C(2))-methyltransferase RlmN [Aciditerrimonas ferrireducens]MCK4177292.1 23S rRNA (adenine(2503)-C(2))-methyltransferase RlmN [Aciditerrimonas ferrireducens]